MLLSQPKDLPRNEGETFNAKPKEGLTFQREQLFPSVYAFFLGIIFAASLFLLWLKRLEQPLIYQYVSRPITLITPIPPISPNQVKGSTQAKSNLININTATFSQLDSLPGIGPARGQKIIANRPYQRTEDLLIKKVLPRSVFDQIKEQISVQ